MSGIVPSMSSSSFDVFFRVCLFQKDLMQVSCQLQLDRKIELLPGIPRDNTYGRRSRCARGSQREWQPTIAATCLPGRSRVQHALLSP